jgi:hypothetical protein
VDPVDPDPDSDPYPAPQHCSGGTDSAVELIPRWNRLLDVDLKISINGNAA